VEAAPQRRGQLDERLLVAARGCF
jgi:hypothetical protein